MHEVLVNRLGGLSLPRKSVVRLTDRPDMTLDVYRGRKTTMQQQQQCKTCRLFCSSVASEIIVVDFSFRYLCLVISGKSAPVCSLYKVKLNL